MDVMEWAENKVEHLDPVNLALIKWSCLAGGVLLLVVLALGAIVAAGAAGVADLTVPRASALAVAVLCGFGERGDFGEADLILGSTSELAAWL